MTVPSQYVSCQVLTSQPDVAVDAWLSLLRAHGCAARALAGQLEAEHGLTIADYEALMQLARAEGQRLRRVDLASRLQLSPSGVTRLLQGLESAGLVEKGNDPGDARVTYAVLTPAGGAKLDAASCSHVAAVKELLEQTYDPDELQMLAELLGRLPGPSDACDAACH